MKGRYVLPPPVEEGKGKDVRETLAGEGGCCGGQREGWAEGKAGRRTGEGRDEIQGNEKDERRNEGQGERQRMTEAKEQRRGSRGVSRLAY